MANKSYHHGDLRNALIEAGIEYINENGVSQFSLRKAAAKCGVSHTAPYSHFNDKDDLLEAMKNYVTDRFAEALEEAQQIKVEESYTVITNVGVAYVEFFSKNPQYYPFVFARADFDINLDSIDEPSRYRPFEIFRSEAVKLFEEYKIPRHCHQQLIIKMWSMVHGMAGISVMQGVRFSTDWDVMARMILESTRQ